MRKGSHVPEVFLRGSAGISCGGCRKPAGRGNQQGILLFSGGQSHHQDAVSPSVRRIPDRPWARASGKPDTGTFWGYDRNVRNAGSGPPGASALV